MTDSDKTITELNELLVKTDKDELAIVDFNTGITKKISSVNLITKLDYADGFVVKYDTTTSIAITSGEIAANGKIYNLSADTTHSMTSLASAFDMHYIYIDDSESTVPDAVIIDSTTEPTFSDSKRGFYSGDDKCISVVVSPAGSSTIGYFDTVVISPTIIEYYYNMSAFPQMATAMDPSGVWQKPFPNDGSAVTPVNANKIYLRFSGLDLGGQANIFIANKDFTDDDSTINNAYIRWAAGETIMGSIMLALGASRDVRITGNDGDDNAMNLNCSGFGIKR